MIIMGTSVFIMPDPVNRSQLSHINDFHFFRSRIVGAGQLTHQPMIVVGSLLSLHLVFHPVQYLTGSS